MSHTSASAPDLASGRIPDVPSDESVVAGTVNTIPIHPRRPRIEADRRFGAHVRTRWWAPLLVLPVVLIGMLVIQIVLVSAQ